MGYLKSARLARSCACEGAYTASFALIAGVKKKRIIFIAMLLLLVVALAIQLLRPKEPSYRGKTLTEWLKKYEADRTESGQAVCERAINAIGTNGIPTLLKLLTASGFPGSARLQNIVDRLGWTNFHAFDASRLATLGFLTLGQTAKFATPKLIELARTSRSPLTRQYALWSLEQIKAGKDILVPVFAQSLGDPDSGIAKYAAERFYALYPEDAQKAGADKLLTPVNAFHHQRTRVKIDRSK